MVEDRREIGTTYAFAPPRVFENMLTLTMVRMEDASALKRRMFKFFIDHANRGRREDPQSRAGRAPLATGCSTGSATVLVYAPLKNRFGLTQHQGRLHGRRGDRAGDLPVLPRASAST